MTTKQKLKKEIFTKFRKLINKSTIAELKETLVYLDYALK